MKKLNYILSLVLSVAFLVSCDYGDENVDPTRPSEGVVDLKLVLPAALTQAAYNNMASPNRLTGIVMQHFDGFDAQQIEYMIYDIDENALDNYWNFGLYGGVMKDCIVLMEKGEAEEQPYYVGIAKILMANALGTATSIFGDVPYSEAFQGTDNLKPAYDSQESVYAAVQTLLDEAITELSKPAVGGGPAADDLIFGGDAAKWIATAYAFKARYYMHTVNRNSSAHTQALSAIANAFSSSADQPDFVFGSSQNFANPMAKFGAERPNTLVMNAGFVAKLAGDPREDLITDGANFFTSATDGLFWSSNDSPSPLISYTEIKFLEAEAEARAGNMGAANTALQAAVTSNMDYMGVDGTAYVAAMTDISGMSLNNALSVIMDESYIGLYGQAAVEVWTNYRRTGLPALTPNAQGRNGNNPSGVIPRRVSYPQNERVTNAESLNAAISAQGGALLDDDLWAFKN